jgi:colanic acid/amylovoran biosynthesis glycosyltransferase
MKVAYLVNQYPKTSHSFIRREILALERRGGYPYRGSLFGRETRCRLIRRIGEELERTQVVLAEGAVRLARHVLATFSGLTSRFLRAMACNENGVACRAPVAVSLDLFFRGLRGRALDS